MAHLVGGFCVPHDPLILGARDAAPPEQAARVFSSFEAIRRQAAGLRPDAAIVIGDDHCAMFDPACRPSLLIGIGELEGPIEPWLGLPRSPVPCATRIAEFIMDHGFSRGFDWAVSRTLALDHSTMVPIHLALPPGLPIVPVYISSGMKPFIQARRCRELGKMIGDAVRAMPGDARVVIVGTGGISHWVGMADMGRINEDFDRRILDITARGDLDALESLADEEIIASAGNGALEIRNWIVAMSALPGCRGEIVHYEAVAPWITGLGFVAIPSRAAEAGDLNFRVRVRKGACYAGRGAAGETIPVAPGGYRATLDLRESLFGPELVLIVSPEETGAREGIEILLARYPDLWDFPRVPDGSGLEVLA